MLENIKIDSLFGYYNYSLDLNPENNSYKFITGPNGYGKSTILTLLNALYSTNLKLVAAIPFKSLELSYEDGSLVLIEQERKIHQDEGSDEETKSDIELNVSYKFRNSDDIKRFPAVRYDSDDIVNGNETDENKDEVANLGLFLFFNSHPVYYIRDGRINTPEGEPAVKHCAERMKKLLENADHGQVDDFDKRVSLFEDIVKHAKFTHKGMEVGSRFGFRFRSDDDDRTILKLEGLSSGEQHIIIQTFELLFEAPDDSLVLIDEPEISFHMAWQMEYLRNLKSISELRHLQFIVATHSPQIFASQWNLAVDLYDLSKQ